MSGVNVGRKARPTFGAGYVCVWGGLLFGGVGDVGRKARPAFGAGYVCVGTVCFLAVVGMSGVKPDPRLALEQRTAGGGGQLSVIRKIESEHNRPLFDRTGGRVPEFCANDLFRCRRSPDLSLCSGHSMRWSQSQ